MGGNKPDGLKLYNFTDNHDVERIYTKLNNKAHFAPVHILEYTLPGVPSIYYGSEFGIEGRKEQFSDASLRPALNLEDYKDAVTNNSFTRLLAALGKTRQNCKALSYGDYKELILMNRQYAFSRNYNGESVVVAVNNDDSDYTMTLPVGNAAEYIGALSGEKVSVNNGNIVVTIKANYGEIWMPVTNGNDKAKDISPVELNVADAVADITPDSTSANETKDTAAEAVAAPQDTTANASSDNSAEEKQETSAVSPAAETNANNSVFDAEQLAFEKGKIAGLQEAILAIMEKNGPVTDQMRKDVEANVYHDSLINWVKSFR